MNIFDGHLDLAWNAVSWERDLRLPLSELRRTADGRPRDQDINTVCFPEMVRGRVGFCCATVTARCSGGNTAGLDYPTVALAQRSIQQQLLYYQRLQENGLARVITDTGGLDRHADAWLTEPSGDKRLPPIGLILLMECADPVAEPGELARWHQAGIRAVGPAHFGVNRYAAGTGEEGGFSAAGILLLKEMQRLGMILDASHLSDRSFSEGMDAFGGKVMASHSNSRALVPGPRQLDDDQMDAVIRRQGVIGTALEASMLVPDLKPSEGRGRVSLENAAEQIDHVCQLAGNSRHAAIGSDLDGGFGAEWCPRDLDSIADLQKLAGLLAGRGHGPADIENILWGNWLRFFREAFQDSR